MVLNTLDGGEKVASTVVTTTWSIRPSLLAASTPFTAPTYERTKCMIRKREGIDTIEGEHIDCLISHAFAPLDLGSLSGFVVDSDASLTRQEL